MKIKNNQGDTILDYDGANLQGANLQGADLQGANLWRADLLEADLLEANLQRANLQGANLQRANLQRANLQRANLQRANLQRANLWGATVKTSNKKVLSLPADLHPIQINTDVYQTTILGGYMQIGCENHTVTEWFSFTDEQILKMDGKKALTFWKKWKPILQLTCEETKP